MNDEKLIEMAKNYLSVDESLDKFQFKYKKVENIRLYCKFIKKMV